jgi:hypothetical protein
MQPQFIAPAVLVLGIGTHWAWTYFPLLLRARRSVGWPCTPGTVLGRSAADADGHPAIRSYSMSISFRYVVDQVAYTGSTLGYKYALPFFSMEQLVAVQRPYPVGTAVVVFYDPARPQHAVLEPGVGVGNYVTVLLTSAVLALGLRLAYAAAA